MTEREEEGERLTDVDGCLLLVSSENPHFDVGTPQSGYTLRNTLCREHREKLPGASWPHQLLHATSAGYMPHQLGTCHISWVHATSAATCHISWVHATSAGYMYSLWPLLDCSNYWNVLIIGMF